MAKTLPYIPNDRSDLEYEFAVTCFVNKNILMSANVLVQQIREAFVNCEKIPFPDYEEDIFTIMRGKIDFEEVAMDHGWIKVEDSDIRFYDGDGAFSKAESWEELVREQEFRQEITPDDIDRFQQEWYSIEEDDVTFIRVSYGETSYVNSWEELCAEQNIDADDYASEFETYFFVSDFLAEKLSEKGQTVLHQFFDAPLWCRGISGQAVADDAVIQDIYDEANIFDSYKIKKYAAIGIDL